MAANRAGSGAYRPPRRTRTTADIITDVAETLARIAAVVFLVALVFTLFAVFSDSLKDYPVGYNQETAARLTSNVTLASNALIWSAGVLMLCLIIVLWGWQFAFPILLAAGAILYVGLPYFGVPHISRMAMNVAVTLHPGAIIVQGWRTTGMIVFAAGGLFLLEWAWEQLQASLASSRRMGGGLKVPFYSACWQTHFCKPQINRLCSPGRKGFRKSCWRHKSGCFCDESIGDKVLASARKGAGKAAEQFFSAPARAPAPTFGDFFRSTRHRVANQRIACADCPIYNYHEHQKHRILAPVFMLAVPALMYYYGAELHRTYQGFVNAMDRFALHLGFSAESTRTLTNQIHGAFGEPIVEYMVYALLAIVLITAAARLLEWWCFEAKL